ncbi:Uncharacterised protein [Mycobacteroides abscessus subsp. abscessus]|nr:Uncharacterised protein [Mycobacteroides abscessus subsp. abscessus]
MLELVEVEFTLCERRIGLVVVGEVHQLDVDALRRSLLLEHIPVLLGRVGDADLDLRRVVVATTGRQHRPTEHEQQQDGENFRPHDDLRESQSTLI